MEQKLSLFVMILKRWYNYKIKKEDNIFPMIPPGAGVDEILLEQQQF